MTNNEDLIKYLGGGIMKFSIIIPVYNVKKYLKDSIESVLRQEYQNYELIIVDDGSTDGSSEICDKYREKSKTIKVIHKTNGGLSDARNFGLNVATGDYILFLDSDDLLADNILIKVARILKDKKYPELLIADMINWIGDKKYSMNPFEPKKVLDNNVEDTINNFVINYNFIPWAAYQNIYKRTFLEDNNFNVEIIGAEDCDFFMRIIKEVNTFVVTDLKLVIYRMNREGSIITKPNCKSVTGQLLVFAEQYDYAEKIENKVIQKFFADRFTNIIILIGLFKSSEANTLENIVMKHDYIVKNTNMKAKYIISRIIWKILGFYKGSRFLLKMRR